MVTTFVHFSYRIHLQIKFIRPSYFYKYVQGCLFYGTSCCPQSCARRSLSNVQRVPVIRYRSFEFVSGNSPLQGTLGWISGFFGKWPYIRYTQKVWVSDSEIYSLVTSTYCTYFRTFFRLFFSEVFILMTNSPTTCTLELYRTSCTPVLNRLNKWL